MVIHCCQAKGQTGVMGIGENIQFFLTGMPKLRQGICNWEDTVLEQHFGDTAQCMNVWFEHNN